MATRTIESRSSRLITMLITPFMSCGARLPIYVLLAGAFFPEHAGVVMFALYVLGVLVAALTAWLMRRFFFRRDETPFVMELPPYRVPTMRSTVRHMWEKAAQYLRKMGGVILVASIVVWFLSYFPQTGGDGAQQMEQSYIGRAGHAMEPAMGPLGLDWKATVSLISGMAAKEIVVSTLGVLGENAMTARSALAFLVFALLYFPCIAALAAIAREAGSWKYALFSLVYTTGVAWAVAWAVYRIAGIFL
jgi:ferrous iron transport protein B